MYHKIDGVAQDGDNFIAYALGLSQPCVNPWNAKETKPIIMTIIRIM